MLRDAYIGEDKISRIYTGEHLVHPSPVMDGLVLWYDFMGRKNSDAKRGVAEDLSGNGNHGTLTNFAYQPGSGYEDGLRFDGVDDYISTVPLGDFRDTHVEFLVDYEIKSGISTLIADSNQSSTSGFIWVYRTSSNNLSAQYTHSDGYSSVSAITPGLTDSTMALLGVTYLYSKGVIRFYANGELVREFNHGSPFASPPPRNRVIGSYDVERHLRKGTMASVRIYNRALTPEEIQHNYQMEKVRWNL